MAGSRPPRRSSMDDRGLVLAALVAALSVYPLAGENARSAAIGSTDASIHLAESSSSAPAAGATSGSATSATTDAASEMQRVKDQYGKEMRYWEEKVKNAPQLPDQQAGENQSDKSWVSVTWLEVKGEWSKLQVATADTWSASRESFEKAFGAFKKAWSEAHPG